LNANGIQLSISEGDEKCCMWANTPVNTSGFMTSLLTAQSQQIRNFANWDGWKNEDNVWSSGADWSCIDDNDRLYGASNLELKC